MKSLSDLLQFSLFLLFYVRSVLSQDSANATLPILFGRCSTLVTHSMCYNLLGDSVSVLYPTRRSISTDKSLSDQQILELYEKRIQFEVDMYASSGISLGSEECRNSVLLTVCLQYYVVCSPSEPSEDCRFPCDKWRAHVAGSCECTERPSCYSMLEKVFSSCPLEEGPTKLISKRRSVCQTLPKDVKDSIVNTTPSVDVMQCHKLPESSFCHPVLQSSPVVHSSTHHLLDRVARQRYNHTTLYFGVPYLNLSSESCESAIRLYTCMATYTPCRSTGGGHFTNSEFCSEINATTIFRKILDICECTRKGNCRQHIFGSVDGTLNLHVQRAELKGQQCQLLPNDIRSLFLNVSEVTASPYPTTSTTSIASTRNVPPSLIQPSLTLLTPLLTTRTAHVSASTVLPSPLSTNHPNVNDFNCPPFEDNSSLNSFSTSVHIVVVCLSFVLLVFGL